MDGGGPRGWLIEHDGHASLSVGNVFLVMNRFTMQRFCHHCGWHVKANGHAESPTPAYQTPSHVVQATPDTIPTCVRHANLMSCRWHVKPDGHADPSVRTLMRPLLNLFHGEPGCKRWKNAVDELLRTGGNTITIRE